MTVEMEYLNTLENYKTDYLNVLEEFLKISKPHIGFSVLDDLKSYYSNVIRSVRQSDYINNLDGLVRVLEKRDALSYVNIEPLKYISATYVRDPVLDRLLRNYEERTSDRPPVPLFNAYDVPSAPLYEDHTSVAISPMSSSGSQRHQIRAQMTFYTTPQPSFHLTLPGSVQNGPFNQSSNENFEQTQRIVLLEISEKLGRHWRDVARLLGVTENDIDEINYNLEMPLKEKAFKALLKIQSKCDPLQWRSKLQRALERARRRDLVELVDELYTRKHG